MTVFPDASAPPSPANVAASAVDPLAGLADRIRAHSRFPAALLHYASSLLSWRQGPRLLNKVIASHARIQIMNSLLVLQCIADPGDPDDGPSYVKILSLLKRRHDGGPRMVNTMLALLRLGGFVTITRGARDRRLRLYRPSEKMLGMVRDWYGNTFGCFDLLVGRDVYAARMRSDPEFLRHFMATVGYAYLVEQIPVMERHPQILALYELDGGFPVAASLVEAVLKSEPLPSPAAIARLFGISASQVRNVLRVAVVHGLITLSLDGKVEDCTSLVDLFSATVARELALYASHLDIPV